MFINPNRAIEEGWITGIVDAEKQVQPNAIDFTLDVVYNINHQMFVISEEGGKQMRGGSKLLPVTDRSSGIDFWTLHAGQVYDGMSDIAVDLPEGVAAMLIVRSTFNRNGIFLTSGLYDSGYQGHIGFAIHNRGDIAKVGVGTRIGQIKFIASDSAGMYAGGWNHESGKHWSEEP